MGEDFVSLPTYNVDKGFNLRGLANELINWCEETLDESNILDQGIQHFMMLLIRADTVRHVSIYKYHHSQYSKIDPGNKSKYPPLVVLKKTVVSNGRLIMAVLFK